MNSSFDSIKGVILGEIKQVLDSIDPDQVSNLIDSILFADKVFTVGVGRVALSLQAFTKRLAHLGIDAHCVGDITEPAITDKDLLIVGSGSGTTLFPVAIAKKARSVGAKCIHIGSNTDSDIKDVIDGMVRFPTRTKLYKDDEIESMQPMTSLFEQCLLIFGDIVAMMIIEGKQLDLKSLWQYHANLE